MIGGCLIVALFGIGLWGVVAQHNLVKKVFALNILYSSVVMLFVYNGSRSGTHAPIMTVDAAGVMVDPVPQALMLTAIVIGVCVTALALCVVRGLYERFGTLDIREIEQRRDDSDA